MAGQRDKKQACGLSPPQEHTAVVCSFGQQGALDSKAKWHGTRLGRVRHWAPGTPSLLSASVPLTHHPALT